MRSYVLQARWLPWHAFCAVALAGCLGMAYWQWSVAVAPHVPGAPVQVWRNYAYAINWLIFAGVGVWFWWRYMRDQRAADARRSAEGTAAAAGGSGEQVGGADASSAAEPPSGVSLSGTPADGRTDAERRPEVARTLDFDVFAPPGGEASEADGRGAGRRG